ncbi:YcaO-like family protein [Actinoplanes sp. NPDC051343]|uniref:YcaO-like family protein n=1 Tax=Actinoplanes sp. NPDC051343 TaxID=3363906 RepID=UPI0037A4F21C
MLQDLVSPLGGLVNDVSRLPVDPSNPQLAVFSAALGDLSAVLVDQCGPECLGSLDGAGTGLDAERAEIVAVAESLERYANCVYDQRQFRWATAEELEALGEDAVDLDSLPRCSPTELADPECPVVRPDRTARIRWIRGLNMRTGKPAWVPAALVYIHFPSEDAERITNPISTGSAAHPDPAVAVCGALCEVIERDAISLTWLQQLALPQIEIDVAGPHLRRFLDAVADREMTVRLFDATTDVGIPTVYGVSIAPDHPRLHTVVSCATALDPQAAAAKAICELVSVRIALQDDEPSAEDVESFTGVSDGATYMCVPERASAFDFLLDSPARRRLSEMPALSTGDSTADLRLVCSRLAGSGMDAYIVDLTTDEALRVGMTVVRAVVPGLQPLTFHYRARFLGHPRLYEAPARMGYPVRGEAELNAWPQPFA